MAGGGAILLLAGPSLIPSRVRILGTIIRLSALLEGVPLNMQMTFFAARTVWVARCGVLANRGLRRLGTGGATA